MKKAALIVVMAAVFISCGTVVGWNDPDNIDPKIGMSVAELREHLRESGWAPLAVDSWETITAQGTMRTLVYCVSNFGGCTDRMYFRFVNDRLSSISRI